MQGGRSHSIASRLGGAVSLHSRAISFFGAAVVIALNLLTFELVAYVSANLLVRRNLLYVPPGIENFDQYLDERDPVLGWPSKTSLSSSHDEFGSRPNPSFSVLHHSCVSLYGDAATFGSGVSDARTWATLLSQDLGCRVANYGVPGYGTDQAFLRYSLNRRDEAPVVVLNHYSGDIRRNVNQMRNLISPTSEVLLKPRFVFHEGELTLVPLPQLSMEQAERLIDNPAEFIPHEYFLPGTGRGVVVARFPYLFAVARLFFSGEMHSGAGVDPIWAEFYQPTHASRALPVTIAIIEKFVAEARSRGQEPIVTVIPDPSEFLVLVRTGRFPYLPLIEGLDMRGVPVIDIGMAMVQRLKERHPCELSSDRRCGGHFNEDGHRLIADILASYFALPDEYGDDDGGAGGTMVRRAPRAEDNGLPFHVHKLMLSMQR